MLADQAVRLGDAKLVFAAGMENMTQEPTSFRSYEPLGDLWLDGLVRYHGSSS